jgi:hypothetical protein
VGCTTTQDRQHCPGRISTMTIKLIEQTIARRRLVRLRRVDRLISDVRIGSRSPRGVVRGAALAGFSADTGSRPAAEQHASVLMWQGLPTLRPITKPLADLSGVIHGCRLLCMPAGSIPAWLFLRGTQTMSDEGDHKPDIGGNQDSIAADITARDTTCGEVWRVRRAPPLARPRPSRSTEWRRAMPHRTRIYEAPHVSHRSGSARRRCRPRRRGAAFSSLDHVPG